jgi:hypothetical protein
MVKMDGTIRVRDYSGQKASMNPNLQDMDAAGTTYGSISQDLDEIKDGIDPLIIGAIEYSKVSATYPETGQAAPTVQAAVEGKWEITYMDTTPYLGAASTVPNPGYGQLFTLEIPTADRTLLDGNEEFLDLEDVTVAASVALVEPNIRSPYNRATAQAVTPTNQIMQIKYVGRNL